MNLPIPARHPAQPRAVPAALRLFAALFGLHGCAGFINNIGQTPGLP